MDASFGAAIQTVDKSLKAVSMGLKRLYYHQGTINQGQFSCRKRAGGMGAKHRHSKFQLVPIKPSQHPLLRRLLLCAGAIGR